MVLKYNKFTSMCLVTRPIPTIRSSLSNCRHYVSCIEYTNVYILEMAQTVDNSFGNKVNSQLDITDLCSEIHYPRDTISD